MSRVPSGESQLPPDYPPGSSRGNPVSARAHGAEAACTGVGVGARARLRALLRLALRPCGSTPSLGLGRLGSCQAWLARGWVWPRDRPRARLALMRQCVLLAAVGQGSGRVGNFGSEHVLRVASGPQPSSVPVLWAARPLCPHLPSALHLGLPLPPSLLTALLPPGVTQDDTMLGGRRGWDTQLSFGPCRTPATAGLPSRSRGTASPAFSVQPGGPSSVF